MKIYTVAIIGVGSRGAFTYGKIMNDQKDKFKIVSLCDLRPGQLEVYKSEFNVSDNNCFTSEDEFFKEKRADVLIVATQDRDHVRMALKGLKLGYDILLEKPISPNKDELYELLKVQKETGRIVLVCHVLRYAPAFLKVKELIDSGKIGRIIKLESLERVAYWHQAHSYVRGNWRREEDTSPMIMAKCCHDLDIIQWYVSSKCDSVYSVGDLTFFKKENQPKEASDRCQDCKLKETCPYSAELLYVKKFLERNRFQNWPFNVLIPDIKPFNEFDLRKAYENGPYGRCVFACDNNVVDYQQVEMIFKNGIKASHTMTAFTEQSGRRFDIHGTYGEIVFDEALNSITLFEYSGLSDPKVTTWEINKLLADFETKGFGHGGGDVCMIAKFYDILEGKVAPDTSLDASVESHLIAIAAEESRKTNAVVKIKH